MPPVGFEDEEFRQYRFDSGQRLWILRPYQSGHLPYIGWKRPLLQVVPPDHPGVDGILDQRQVRSRCGIVAEVVFVVVHATTPGRWARTTAHSRGDRVTICGGPLR